MKFETSTAAGVAEMLRDAMNAGVPEGLEYTVDSILSELKIDPEWLKTFEGVTIQWMEDNEYDPYASDDAWVDELESGAYLLTAGSPTPRYAVIVCSVPWYGGGRTWIHWKGRVLDI